jgi:tripartite-type tricarboxylate transporter receptor subunit TctC
MRPVYNSCIVEKLNRELNRILRAPEVKQRLDQLGMDMEGGTPEHFEKFISGQANAMRALLKRGALQLE